MYGLVCGVSGWTRAVDGMNVFEPSPFTKFAKLIEPGVIPRDSFVGGVLLEVERSSDGKSRSQSPRKHGAVSEKP